MSITFKGNSTFYLGTQVQHVASSGRGVIGAGDPQHLSPGWCCIRVRDHAVISTLASGHPANRLESFGSLNP
jgi:hypothetical protein